MDDRYSVVSVVNVYWRVSMLRVVLVFFLLILLPERILAKSTRTIVDKEWTYVGSVRSGVPSGSGTMSYSDGKVYEGEFRRGMAHGEGTLTTSNGSYYFGSWKNSRMHGQGVRVTQLGQRTEGVFKNGQLNGAAKVSLPNGNQYEGSWLKGKLIGRVTYVFANSDVYSGTFEPSTNAGIGILRKANHDVYEGPILNLKLEGFGEYSYDASGEHFIGYFTAGLKNGSGTVTFSNGHRFEGYWQNGSPSGKGTHTDLAGNSRSGLYSERETNKLVSKPENTAGESGSQVTKVDSSCLEYGYELVAVADGVWKNLEFSTKSGTSSCLE